MQEKNPFNYPWLTYAWVLGLAATGGLIAALKREQSTKKTCVDVMASAFAGLITFWFCEANGINPLYSAIFIAVNGHLGTKALTMLAMHFAGKYLPQSGGANQWKPEEETEEPSPPTAVPRTRKKKPKPKDETSDGNSETDT